MSNEPKVITHKTLDGKIELDVDLDRFEESDEVEQSEAYFAPPTEQREAHVEGGVLWRGPWDLGPVGMGVASRQHALALNSAGVPVKLYSAGMFLEPLPGRVFNPLTELDPLIVEQVGHLRSTNVVAPTAIIHHLVPSYDTVRRALYPSMTDALDTDTAEATHCRRILMSVWERDRADRRVASLLPKFGQHWVPCKRNVKLLKAAGVPEERILVVPHPIDPASPLRAMQSIKRGNKDWFYFLTVGKWEPRKNTHGVIGAFLLSFRPKDKAKLIVKTSDYAKVADYPTNTKESFAAWLADHDVAGNGWTIENIAEHVMVISTTIPTAELWRLYQGADAFVSASHGEGFDLPTFDACLAGLRVVHTGFGGSEDYAPPESVRVWMDSDGTEVVHPIYAWPLARWAKVKLNNVGLGMLIAFHDRMGSVPFDHKPYTMETVGKIMADGIRSLRGVKS